MLFPKEMGVFPYDDKKLPRVIVEKGKDIFQRSNIIRKIPLTGNALDVVSTAKILQALATTALEGRADTRITAAEALGLCWVCLTSSRLGFPTEEEMLYETSSLIYPQESNDEQKTLHKNQLLIPTFFGDIPFEVSSVQYEYLKALHFSGLRTSLFKSALGSLRVAFDRAVDDANLNSKLGRITFLSLMRPPHLAIDRRCQKRPLHSL